MFFLHHFPIGKRKKSVRQYRFGLVIFGPIFFFFRSSGLYRPTVIEHKIITISLYDYMLQLQKLIALRGVYVCVYLCVYFSSLNMDFVYMELDPYL